VEIPTSWLTGDSQNEEILFDPHKSRGWCISPARATTVNFVNQQRGETSLTRAILSRTNTHAHQ
jgi:hypothetical protein